MRYTALVDRIAGEGSRAWEVHTRAMRKRAAGEDVIVLTIGDPDFDTPRAITDTAIESLRAGRTHYSGAVGEAALRRSIARHQSRLLGRRVEVSNVAVVPGVQCGLYCAAMCLLEAGDEVIVPEPMYVTYDTVAGAVGARIVSVPLAPERDFHLEADSVARAVTPRTRALLINTPHNPTGAITSRETLEALAEICVEHDLWLIADEVYADTTFEHRHVSALEIPGLEDRAVGLSSLSKSHAMTGWRIGWMVGPETLMAHVERLLGAMLYGSPQFIQDAAVEALNGGLNEVERMRSAYRARRDVVYAALSGLAGIGCHLPEGGMYLMIDVRPTGLDGETFANRLLDEAGVSVLPGKGFGPSAAGHVRLSLTESEEVLLEACRRIETFVRPTEARRSR